jgi:hypothetical protein
MEKISLYGQITSWETPLFIKIFHFYLFSITCRPKVSSLSLIFLLGTGLREFCMARHSMIPLLIYRVWFNPSFSTSMVVKSSIELVNIIGVGEPMNTLSRKAMNLCWLNPPFPLSQTYGGLFGIWMVFRK